MFKKVALFSCIVLLLVFAYLYLFPHIDYSTVVNSNGIGIARHPAPSKFPRGIMKELPHYNSASSANFQVDLRGYDLSALNLADKLGDLEFADFDSMTKWPAELPGGFVPDEIMEAGKNPGLSIRSLHEKGINGKNIGVAIIDQCLLTDHAEYKERLKFYEEIHNIDESAPMHGVAVASLAVGKTIGVAPMADLYYIAETHASYNRVRPIFDFTWLAKAIDRIVEINRELPADKKIRVISISVGWSRPEKGYDAVTRALDNAKKEGIFIVSSNLQETYGFYFQGLGRDPKRNPDEPGSYSPGLFWEGNFYKRPAVLSAPTLLVPMDSRTVASQSGVEEYTFYRSGGWSWSIPYIAGLYALACQVKPDITPDEFWQTALETGDSIRVTHDGKEYDMKSIANPVKLIETLANSK